jgi:NitT/TauT family transport system substrate-binding protein
MKQTICFLIALLVLASCGPSLEEKRRITRRQRAEMLRADSAALKVAVMPTLDCLPLIVAKHDGYFDKLGADVRFRTFTAQMDCDTALAGGSVQGAVTDLVRAERLIKKGTPLQYVTSTDAYWQVYANRMARITTLKQLDDKMLAMTRYSATDLLSDVVIDSAKLDRDRFFKIQVNDVYVRLKMLIGHEIDAALLTEPQASQARLARHKLLLDSRDLSWRLGLIAFREKDLKDSTRQHQLEVFKKGYDMACDSLTRYGIGHFRQWVLKYYKMTDKEIDSLSTSLKFSRMSPPAEADVERARKFLKL